MKKSECIRRLMREYKNLMSNINKYVLKMIFENGGVGNNYVRDVEWVINMLMRFGDIRELMVWDRIHFSC
jgi:hypothetical protein